MATKNKRFGGYDENYKVGKATVIQSDKLGKGYFGENTVKKQQGGEMNKLK